MSYIDKEQIKIIQSINSSFNTEHLISILYEINKCYANECYIASGILIRSLLDHIPPLFGKHNFDEVVNNYLWDPSSARSSKKIVNSLNAKIDYFDLNIHKQINKQNQNLGQNELDLTDSTTLKLLLNEMIALLKKESTSNIHTISTELSDPLFAESVKVLLNAKRGSATVIQSQLRIAYSRASRLIKELEEKGIVGPANGSEPREVLVQNAENYLKINKIYF